MLSFIKDFVQLGLDVVEARLPFRIVTGVTGIQSTVFVTIINHTKNMPLHVHSVRIHHGLSTFNYSFVLAPTESVEISPRNRKEFSIPFVGTTVQRFRASKVPPTNKDPGPSFDSPADLFKAIAHGRARDSWIEIDFNEFHKRKFRRGKLKDLFLSIIKAGPPNA